MICWRWHQPWDLLQGWLGPVDVTEAFKIRFRCSETRVERITENRFVWGGGTPFTKMFIYKRRRYHMIRELLDFAGAMYWNEWLGDIGYLEIPVYFYDIYNNYKQGTSINLKILQIGLKNKAPRIYINRKVHWRKQILYRGWWVTFVYLLSLHETLKFSPS